MITYGDDLYCVIAVDTALSRHVLAVQVATVLHGSVGPSTDPTPTALTPELAIDVWLNGDYDPTRRSHFPDGFLYFRYRLELYPRRGLERQRRVAVVTTLLAQLWAAGIPAIAACDDEALLPHQGGYRSPAVPWPNQ